MPQVLKEEVRDRILAAATGEFFESGFNGTSMRSIAKGAGITAGNLYRYYDSKEKIYEAVVGDSYRQLNSVLEKRSQNRITITQSPDLAFIGEMQQEEVRKIIRESIREVVEIFDDRRMGLLILIRDDREDTDMDSRVSLMSWFTAHFEQLYKDSQIAKYLAYSFTEGLIKIALEEDEHLSERVEALVEFFFMRGERTNDEA